MFAKLSCSCSWRGMCAKSVPKITFQVGHFILAWFAIKVSPRSRAGRLGPIEHFQIKWGQGYVSGIICPLIGIGLMGLMYLSEVSWDLSPMSPYFPPVRKIRPNLTNKKLHLQLFTQDSGLFLDNLSLIIRTGPKSVSCLKEISRKILIDFIYCRINCTSLFLQVPTFLVLR